ncbi:MAG: type IV pilus assembly protein PilM [Deltaproteobacteria bacterium]
MAQLLEKFKNKFPKERFSVGLDIGTSSVKAVKLRFHKDGVELYGVGFEPAQFDLEPVVKKIMKPQETDRVNISVSAPAAIIRYVNFPKMSKEELQQALKFEAQKHIPFAITEVNLDSYILKSDLPDNKMLVLMAAVKKDFLSQRLKVIESAGLRANVVDIDSLALVNAFNFNYAEDDNVKNRTVALLNIGASFSNLSILEAGIPCLSRDIQIAGNSLTQKISEAMGLDFKSAEELKLNPDKEKADKLYQAGESVLSNFAREIRISFDYYESQNASSVGKIFLSGAGADFSNLKEMLVNLLGIEVEYWDPLRQVNIANSLEADKIRPICGRLAIAMGLALRA